VSAAPGSRSPSSPHSSARFRRYDPRAATRAAHARSVIPRSLHLPLSNSSCTWIVSNRPRWRHCRYYPSRWDLVPAIETELEIDAMCRGVRLPVEDFRTRRRAGSLTRRSGKEVIQPQVPLRLPCYDFAPVTTFAFGRSPCLRSCCTDFGRSPLPWRDGRCVQGPGTYSPWRG
jgi:hypothetical protein